MTCPAWFAHCRCSVTDEHDTHECPCGGQWTGSDGEADLPKVVRFPQRVLEGPLAGMNVKSAFLASLGFLGES